MIVSRIAAPVAIYEVSLLNEFCNTCCENLRGSSCYNCDLARGGVHPTANSCYPTGGLLVCGKPPWPVHLGVSR